MAARADRADLGQSAGAQLHGMYAFEQLRTPSPVAPRSCLPPCQPRTGGHEDVPFYSALSKFEF
ncbi:hypothetical protein FIBSPDRAFT_873724 [Athelia psychrophila]|uniref:Uncharacterized protein n=1 Tax=Athelia psychrophila TaxID=1759441 RepID=A0A165Y652_9AGAM|nr:hypothetical protein FIBSPDRAFT_873724 [Fibularhizoctonia sp. CBS 109695]